MIDTYGYDSFGNVIASSGTFSNRYLFTGREFDSETGNYYYRSRYYDQVAGRFISEDPVHFAAGVNFYSYVQNRPTIAKDPLGLRTQLCCRPGINKFKRFPGEHHCFVVVSNPDVHGHVSTSYSYLNGPLSSVDGPNGDIGSYNDGSASCTDVSCPCGAEQRIANTYNNSDLVSATMGNFFGPNSNSWARNLLQSAGCSAPSTPPARAYGYGYRP